MAFLREPIVVVTYDNDITVERLWAQADLDEELSSGNAGIRRIPYEISNAIQTAMEELPDLERLMRNGVLPDFSIFVRPLADNYEGF